MTIGFRRLVRPDGQEAYNAVNLSPEATYEETDRAINAIWSTGCNYAGFPAEKLPVVVAALRLAGFEVK